MPNTDQPDAPQPNNARDPNPGRLALRLMGLIGVVAVVMAFVRGLGGGVPHRPIALPELAAQGWLNTADAPPPTRASVAGKWVVLDLFTLWCGPCRAEAPHLADLHRRRLAGRDDVVLIGINPDPGDAPEAIAEFGAIVGFDWPIGHGATLMPDALNAPYLPTLILFTPEGRSVWRGHSVADLERAIDEHLGG